jgi:hypothetical protein
MKPQVLLASGLAVGLLAVALPSQAGSLRVGVVFSSDDHGYGHRDDRGYGYRDTYRVGYDRGREEGFEHGVKDGRRHRDFGFAHDRKYRRGDHGYRRHYGPKHVYVEGFRSGYQAGYRSGYRSAYGHRHHERDDWRERDARDRYDREIDERARRDRERDARCDPRYENCDYN